jgi:hypothetical protein
MAQIALETSELCHSKRATCHLYSKSPCESEYNVSAQFQSLPCSRTSKGDTRVCLQVATSIKLAELLALPSGKHAICNTTSPSGIPGGIQEQWPSFAATTFAKQPSLDEFASHVGVFIWAHTVFDLLYNLYMFAQNLFGRSADDFGLTA